MRKLTPATLLAVVLFAAGCYHATIDTGLQPNGQTIKQPWAMSFVDGLIPPPIVETAAKCPDGVARVETQHSFLNSLVAGITFGIVTPITIEVQCAGKRSSDAGGAVMKVGADDDLQQALMEAARKSEQTGEPVYLQF